MQGALRTKEPDKSPANRLPVRGDDANRLPRDALVDPLQDRLRDPRDGRPHDLRPLRHLALVRRRALLAQGETSANKCAPKDPRRSDTNHQV